MKLILKILIVCLTCFESVFASSWMKGADIYSWKESTGYIWYALLPGTNRLKISDELMKAKMTSAEFINHLNKIPKETYVSWNNSVALDNQDSLKLILPPKEELNRIKKKIAKLGLKLQ